MTFEGCSDGHDHELDLIATIAADLTHGRRVFRAVIRADAAGEVESVLWCIAQANRRLGLRTRTLVQQHGHEYLDIRVFSLEPIDETDAMARRWREQRTTWMREYDADRPWSGI